MFSSINLSYNLIKAAWSVILIIIILFYIIKFANGTLFICTFWFVWVSEIYFTSNRFWKFTNLFLVSEVNSFLIIIFLFGYTRNMHIHTHIWIHICKHRHTYEKIHRNTLLVFYINFKKYFVRFCFHNIDN